MLLCYCSFYDPKHSWRKRDSPLILIAQQHFDEILARNPLAIEPLRRFPAEQRWQKDQIRARILAVRIVQILPAAKFAEKSHVSELFLVIVT